MTMVIAGDMVQRLRVFTALPEDASSVPGTPAPGYLMPSPGLCGHLSTCGIYKAQTRKILTNLFFFFLFVFLS